MTDFCSGGKLASRVHTASVWAGTKLAETNNSARPATTTNLASTERPLKGMLPPVPTTITEASASDSLRAVMFSTTSSRSARCFSNSASSASDSSAPEGSVSFAPEVCASRMSFRLLKSISLSTQATPARPPGVAATAAVRRCVRSHVRVFPHDVYRSFVAGADDVFVNSLLAQFRIAVGEFRPFAVDHTVGRGDVPPAAYVVVQRVQPRTREVFLDGLVPA